MITTNLEYEGHTNTTTTFMKHTIAGVLLSKPKQKKTPSLAVNTQSQHHHPYIIWIDPWYISLWLSFFELPEIWKINKT